MNHFFHHVCLAALLGLGTTLAASAQTAPPDTARFYKHHLGVTASPQLDHFFTANRSLPVGLLYKRQTTANALWRYGLVLNQDYSRRDENNTNPQAIIKSNDEYVYNNWGVSVSVGREFTHRFAPHWMGTAGVDASAGFSRNTREYSYQRFGPPPGAHSQTDRFRYYQANLTPFIGLRYSIWSSLYVSAESAINISYLREVIDSRGSDTNLATRETVFKDFGPQNVTDQFLTLRYKLISQLSLHYLLGRR